MIPGTGAVPAVVVLRGEARDDQAAGKLNEREAEAST